MMKFIKVLVLILCNNLYTPSITMGQGLEKDVFTTGEGKLSVTFVGHGSLMLEWQEKVVHIDPSSREYDYGNLPKADLVLITHHHGDHCDPKAYGLIKKNNTQTVLTSLAHEKLGEGSTITSGQRLEIDDILIEAIPAYNLVHTRENGDVFHPKGCCNSYVLTLGDKRLFIGGDTENTPEMKSLENIDIAFLPMNLPYTMTPEMVADAAKGFRPDILYPYHYGDTNLDELVKLLADVPDIEVRLRKM